MTHEQIVKLATAYTMLIGAVINLATHLLNLLTALPQSF